MWSDPNNLVLPAMLKGGSKAQRQHQSRTPGSRDLIVTWKEAERVGLQGRRETVMKRIVLMVTTMILIERGRPDAQSTSRI